METIKTDKFKDKDKDKETKNNENEFQAFSKDATDKLQGITSRVNQVKDEINKKKSKRTPKTNKKTVEAKEAEEIEVLQQTLHTLFSGGNRIAKNKIGAEYAFEDKEIEALSVLGGKIASKYVDTSTLRYSDEIAFCTILITGLSEKGLQYYENEIKGKKKNKDK